MKIYALIPDDYLKEAQSGLFTFRAYGALGINDAKEMTLIITVRDEEQKVINGTQYIADLNESQDADTCEDSVNTNSAGQYHSSNR